MATHILTVIVQTHIEHGRTVKPGIDPSRSIGDHAEAGVGGDLLTTTTKAEEGDGIDLRYIVQKLNYNNINQTLVSSIPHYQPMASEERHWRQAVGCEN
jgi:hypothetical protein